MVNELWGLRECRALYCAEVFLTTEVRGGGPQRALQFMARIWQFNRMVFFRLGFLSLFAGDLKFLSKEFNSNQLQFNIL
jgi:hypothetical protein